ncbi:MAG TPA: hypothetical protein VFH27_06110 [Longimicrobiaceae bacterium]|nr:hypothetical protein [Longimicrobiaceae bacterium]
MVLKAGGIALPTVDTPFGPLLSTDGGPGEPVAWLLNQAATGAAPGLLDALERGDEVYLPDLYARRPRPDEDLWPARRRWMDWAGATLPHDAYVVGADFLQGVAVVPRATLLALLHRLLQERQSAPNPPAPWLFRPDPIWHEPAPGEDAPLRSLEARAAALDSADDPSTAERRELRTAMEAAGVTTDAFVDEKERALIAWGMPVLASYAAAGRAMRTYLRSPERRAWDAPPDPPRVSLDWFRSSATAPSAAEGAASLVDAERAIVGAELVGEAGELSWPRPEGAWRLRWRRDDGVHAMLVAARPPYAAGG